jgi:hypothetical protein
MTDNDLIEWLETAIDDSFDLGWTSLDAAKLIVSRMQAEGLVLIVKTEPVAISTRCARCYTSVPGAFAAQCAIPECEYRAACGTLGDSDGDDGA